MNMAPFERFCEGVARQLGTPEPSARELYAIGEKLLMLCAKIDAAMVAALPRFSARCFDA